jgi:sRNA-binding protein
MAELDRQVQATLDVLVASYPVFAEGKPLAVGTREQLIERHPDIDLRLLKSALLKHCKRPRYLKALAAVDERYDLDGNSKGVVSNEEREKAIRELQKHREHEQATVQRRLAHAQRELEAVRRKAEKLRAREQQLARARARKANKAAKKGSHSRNRPPPVQAAPHAAGDAGQRRPVIIIKKRHRNSENDAPH